MQEMPCALVLALAKAGKSSPASMAMIAMTTSNSINVNARLGVYSIGCSMRGRLHTIN